MLSRFSSRINSLIEPFWNVNGPYMDTVMSTRARLVRNIDHFPFPGAADDDESQVLLSYMQDVLNKSYSGEVVIHPLSGFSPLERQVLREGSVISPAMQESLNSMLATSDSFRGQIFLNDRDHLRFQSITQGLNVQAARDAVFAMEESLEAHLGYAWSDNFGYLTANPAHAGTGLKVSVLMHLPALSITGRIASENARIRELHTTLEKVANTGDNHVALYHLTTTDSMGMEENEMCELLQETVMDLSIAEDNARDYLREKKWLETEDRIYRARGILSWCRRIGFQEAMEYLSMLRFGVVLALVKNVAISTINDIMVHIQEGMLRISALPDDSNLPVDVMRAEYIHERMSDLDVNV